MPTHYPLPANLRPPPFAPSPDELRSAFSAQLDDWLGGDRVEIDSIFGARDFDDYLADLGSELDDDSVVRLQDHLGEEWWLAETTAGDLVVLRPPSGAASGRVLAEVVGYYTGFQIGVEPSAQGLGLGTFLVLARSVQFGGNPQQDADEAGYSPEGYAVHVRAWEAAQDLLAPGLEEEGPAPG